MPLLHCINSNSKINHSEGFCVARLLHYDNRETPLAGNFVGRCQGRKRLICDPDIVLQNFRLVEFPYYRKINYEIIMIVQQQLC